MMSALVELINMTCKKIQLFSSIVEAHILR